MSDAKADMMAGEATKLPAVGEVMDVLGAVVSVTVNDTEAEVVVFPAASYALAYVV